MAAAEGAGGPGGEEGAASVVAPPAPSSRSASSSPALGGAAPLRRRPLSELRVIDLRAELKRRNLDTGGNKSVLLERLRCAIEEEGGNPDEIPLTPEGSGKKNPKRTMKGRKPEEEGGEDNGLEENSRDGQEDVEASSDNMQDIDMMDISVLDEAEIDNTSTADCGEEYSSENILDSEKDHAEADLPEQLIECEDNSEELDDLLKATLPELSAEKDLKEQHLETENEKVLDILGDSCKSEPLKEDASEPEREEEANLSLLDEKEDEEKEDVVISSVQSEKDFISPVSQSGQDAAQEAEDEAQHLVVVKGDPGEEAGDQESKLDSDSLAVESRSSGGGDDDDDDDGGGGGGGGQSSEAAETLQAGSEETAGTDSGPRGLSHGAEKTEAQAKFQEEASATQGGDQNTSSEENKDAKQALKEEKGHSNASSGRNFWVSGLASTTRATDLKNLFSKYGKVVGAKVVTNARSPGARCYGFVTMSTAEEATKCIAHCHKTDLHGKIISVERAKNEPATKKLLEKKGGEVKNETSASDRSASGKKIEKADQKEDSKNADEKDVKGKEETRSGSADPSKAAKSGSKGTERTVIMDKSKGEPVISVKTSRSKERSVKSQDRKSESREKSRERQHASSFNKNRDQRRPSEDRQQRSTRDRRERQRLEAILEREEREKLDITRKKLEFERARLERERRERERLERERMHIEHERRREQERIQRERDELRRQHEQLRYEQERRMALKRPYDLDGRRDDPYWSEAKRMAMDDRHFSDFNRDRFHDFNYRDRGRYQDYALDRREGRGMMGDRDGQHYGDERHGGPDRHSRDSWGRYGSDRRMSEGRGIPPQSRDGRDWGDHGGKFEGQHDRSWPSNSEDSMGRDQERWQGRGRGRRGQTLQRGGMSGRGGFMQGNLPGQASHGGDAEGESFSGQDRGNRTSDPRFSRRY